MRTSLLLVLGLLAPMPPMVHAGVTLTPATFGSVGGIGVNRAAGIALGFTGGQSATAVSAGAGSCSEAIGFWHWGLPALLGVEPPDESLPRAFEVLPVVPNPFGQRTLIRFAIPGSSGALSVRIGVYDVAGRLVRTLDRSVRGPGVHAVAWDGSSQSGARAAGGIYFCHIQAGPFRAVRRLALVR